MNEKLKKYESDEISNELMIHLRRNISFIEHTISGIENPLKMLIINNKSYFLSKNKKFLVNKIYNIVSEEFDIPESVARRTIKMFLDAFSD